MIQPAPSVAPVGAGWPGYMPGDPIDGEPLPTTCDPPIPERHRRRSRGIIRDPIQLGTVPSMFTPAHADNGSAFSLKPARQSTLWPTLSAAPRLRCRVRAHGERGRELRGSRTALGPEGRNAPSWSRLRQPGDERVRLPRGDGDRRIVPDEGNQVLLPWTSHSLARAAREIVWRRRPPTRRASPVPVRRTPRLVERAGGTVAVARSPAFTRAGRRRVALDPVPRKCFLA